MNNKCVVVWEGTVLKPAFHNFRSEERKSAVRLLPLRLPTSPHHAQTDTAQASWFRPRANCALMRTLNTWIVYIVACYPAGGGSLRGAVQRRIIYITVAPGQLQCARQPF